MPIDFTAIDFETANGSPASPCAVGLVRVRDGVLVEGLALLFKPPYPHNWFHPGNIQVHGIHPADVEDALEYDQALPDMLEFIGTDVLVAHNASFDMGVLRKSAEAIGAEVPDFSYMCSLLMARKSYNLESYRLNAVAYAVGHEDFKHHDALADADACARIVVHMAKKKHDVDSLDDLAAATRQTIKKLHVPVKAAKPDWT